MVRCKPELYSSAHPHSKYENSLQYCEGISGKSYEELKYLVPKMAEHLANYNQTVQ